MFVSGACLTLAARSVAGHLEVMQATKSSCCKGQPRAHENAVAILWRLPRKAINIIIIICEVSQPSVILVAALRILQHVIGMSDGLHISRPHQAQFCCRDTPDMGQQRHDRSEVHWS